MIPKGYSSSVLQVSVAVLLILYCSITFNPLVVITENDYQHVISSNSVIVENKKQGTRIWWSAQSDDEPFIEGFTTTFSNRPSASVVFKISIKSELFNATASLSPQLWIFRMGYYDGYGATLAANISYPLTASQSQPNCLFELSSRMTDCDNWEESVRWNMPHDAASGIYVAIPVVYSQNTNSETTEIRGSYIPFVVKQKENSDTDGGNKRFKGSDILFKTSDFTWVIYNKYGGWNLYRGNGSYTFDSRAVKASYNRPFQNREFKPQGQFENFLFGAEYPMIYWLEKHGYDVSYASCGDVEEMGERGDLTPSNYRILLSIGHDEYYTQRLRDAFKGARDEGVNLAFFSSNEIFWRTTWEQEKTISDGLEYVRTAGKGNLSLSYFTSEHRLEIEKKEDEIEVSMPIKIDSNFTVHNNNSTTVRKTKSIAGENEVKQGLKEYKKEERITREKIIKIRANRVLYCAKETIEGKAKSNSDPEKEWTGTFTDPRFRKPEPELSLTGQKFAVNGFRSDSLEIGEKDSKLRFWRDTDLSLGAVKFPYRTEEGYLGYEWDVFSDDCYKPKGLFSLSSTTKKIKKGLSENFGASYKGTDIVTHKLTIYRHICSGTSNNDDKIATKTATATTVTVTAEAATATAAVEISVSEGDSSETVMTTTTATTVATATAMAGATTDSAITITTESTKKEPVINEISDERITTITDTNTNNNNITNNNNNTNNNTLIRDESLSNFFQSPPPIKQRNLKNKELLGNFENIKSSLVFGAGTLQWSWALSTYHDGPYVPENKYLQQATINLFADMDVQPGELNNEEKEVEKEVVAGNNKGIVGAYSTTDKTKIQENYADKQSYIKFLRGNKNNKILKLAVKSTDFMSPFSVIESPSNNSIIFIQNITVRKDIMSSNKRRNHRRKLQEADSKRNNNNNNKKQKKKDKRDILFHENDKENSDQKNNTEHLNQIQNHEKNHEKKVYHNNNEEDDRFVMFTGYAVDRGGGQVAGVEISTDGGHTWKQTVGGQHWQYKYMVRTYIRTYNTNLIVFFVK